jgi:hypothetical protein
VNIINHLVGSSSLVSVNFCSTVLDSEGLVI